MSIGFISFYVFSRRELPIMVEMSNGNVKTEIAVHGSTPLIQERSPIGITVTTFILLLKVKIELKRFWLK